MFRKEYIKANDNIKVDEELLQKTLDAAFNSKQKRRVYSYRPVTSVAAAIVLVIGCSVAYPRLTQKPVVEDVTPVVTVAPVGDEFLPVVTKAPETTKNPQKKIAETPKPVDEASAVDQTVSIEEPAPVAQMEQNIDNVPSVARFIPEPIAEESLEEQLNLTEGYELKESDDEKYIFENEDGKSFVVTVNEAEAVLDEALWLEDEEEINLTFNEGNKVYNVRSENISKAELTTIFNELLN